MNRQKDIPDDPRQENVGEGEPDQQEAEDGEEEDDSSYCPVFQHSDHFSFMTNDAYSRLEETEVSESEMDKMFKHVRPMRGRVGVLGNPHGSVRLWQGSTAVICAVYGPSDVKISKELPHRAAVDVLYRPKVTGSGNASMMLAAGIMDPIIEERAIEQTVTSVLESVIHLEDHVQAGFNVILHEFENDGCLLSTCINATCLALMNAGCSLRSLFAAVTIGVCGDKIVIDPSSSQIEEMKKCQSTSDNPAPVSLLTFVVSNTTSPRSFSPKVLHVSTTGRVSPKTLSLCYKLITTNESITSEIFEFLSGIISQDLAKCFSEIGLGSESELKDEEDIKTKELKDEEELDEEEDDDNDEEDGEIVSDEDEEL